MSRGSGKGSPVGLLLVSGEGATIAEWHPRRVEILRKLELGLTEAEEHERGAYSKPRATAEKGHVGLSGAQRDLWERRLEDHRARFARSAAHTAARAAESRRWGLVLVLGDPRRTGPALEELRRSHVEAVRSELVLDWLRPAALAERLAPEVERARAELARVGSARR